MALRASADMSSRGGKWCQAPVRTVATWAPCDSPILADAVRLDSISTRSSSSTRNYTGPVAPRNRGVLKSPGVDRRGEPYYHVGRTRGGHGSCVLHHAYTGGPHTSGRRSFLPSRD